MFDFLERTAHILGTEGLERLARSRVALLGLGGVGGAAAEALCRIGVGHLLLVDHDVVDNSNRNRQLLATTATLGLPKTEVAAARLREINPDCQVTTLQRFYLPEDSAFLYDWQPDCVLDAVDTVAAKLHLAQECPKRNIPLLSSMGTGNRLDPSCLRLGDVYETGGNGCPFASTMRKELRRRGVASLRVVYSVEIPVKSICASQSMGRHSPGSTAFVPPAAGFLMAYGAIQQILGL